MATRFPTRDACAPPEVAPNYLQTRLAASRNRRRGVPVTVLLTISCDGPHPARATDAGSHLPDRDRGTFRSWRFAAARDLDDPVVRPPAFPAVGRDSGDVPIEAERALGLAERVQLERDRQLEAGSFGGGLVALAALDLLRPSLLASHDVLPAMAHQHL